jgi:hypothetical protein
MPCPPRETFQIGWICALPIEATAAIEMLDENLGILDLQDITDSHTYTLGRVDKSHVVVACLPGGQYGTTSATIIANHTGKINEENECRSVVAYRKLL